MAKGKRVVSEEEKSRMKLVVLGSNGYRPNDLGHTACYAIPELGLTLDAGTGMYRMVDYLRSSQFDVYLTHAHPNHTWGLTYIEFVFWRKLVREAVARDPEFPMDPIFKSLEESPPMARVHVAPGLQDDVQALVRRFRDNKYIQFVPLNGFEKLSGGATITPFPVAHRPNELCYGFRIDHPGGSLAYVTDTYGEPGASYLESIRGVEVLLHDCYMADRESAIAREIGHSHITPVAQLAAEAQVGRLVLIHLNALRPESGEPELDLAHSIFPRTEVAFDRMEIEF
jgi:ribonuclease Z